MGSKGNNEREEGRRKERKGRKEERKEGAVRTLKETGVRIYVCKSWCLYISQL